MFADRERCIRAVLSNDTRFDGQFVVAVTTTRIYCRPSCPVAPPKAKHMRFLPTAAAAQTAGFRACKRCRPDAAPGSPDWDTHADLVARAMRLIRDGLVDREGVVGLASRLGYSRRHLERQLAAELGASPLALARAQRAQSARLLLEATSLPVGQVAFAAGFGSIRQFNETMQEIFAATPTQLRQRAPARAMSAPGAIALQLQYRWPLDPHSLFDTLVANAVPGVEEWRDGAYRRSMRLPHGPGIVALAKRSNTIHCRLSLFDIRDLPAAIARCRRLLDLDADPVAVSELLAGDPALAPLVHAAPGRRVTRTVDEAEMAIRAALGEGLGAPSGGAGHRSPAVRRIALLVAASGDALVDPEGGLTHMFPTPATVATAALDGMPLEPQRRLRVLGVCRALADAHLDLAPGADRAVMLARLATLPAMDRRTLEVIAVRALGDPDVLGRADPHIRAAARAAGLPGDSRALARHALRWRPWRTYASAHLTAASAG